MQFHDHPLQEWKFIVLAQVFFHYDELEITNHIIPFQAFIATGYVYLVIIYEVFYHFPEHEVDLWFNPKAEAEFHPDNVIGYDMVNGILASVRIIYRIYVDEPINVGPL